MYVYVRLYKISHDSLVIAVKPKAKEGILTAAMLWFYIQQKNCHNRVEFI
jgi:hypothetical protein